MCLRVVLCQLVLFVEEVYHLGALAVMTLLILAITANIWEYGS